MTYLKLIVTAAFLLLIAAIIFLSISLSNANEDKSRLRNNVTVLTSENGILKQIKLKPKEARDHWLIDTIRSIFEAQPPIRKVISYTTYNTESNYYDTTKTKIKPLETVFPIKYDNGCLSYAGLLDTKDSTYTNLFSSYKSTTKELIYWDREKWFWVLNKFWKPKEIFKEVHSPCNDSISVDRIEIVKR